MCLCVQEAREARACCMSVCGKNEMYVGGTGVRVCSCLCMCANAERLAPATLVSLIFSRWDTVSGCNTCMHIYTQTRAQEKYGSFSEPPA